MTAAPRTPSAPAELVIAFANSVDHEEGTDDLTTPVELTRWLVQHGLLERRTASTPQDLTLARSLRDALQKALVANHDESGEYRDLDAVAANLPLTVSGSDGRIGLRPVRDGVPGALSRVLVAVNDAVADGTWSRLKICSSDTCAWAYFDATKNRSRTYCEWGCGNKIKTRNYRARKKAAMRSSGPRPG